jgi:hypothetical protein
MRVSGSTIRQTRAEPLAGEHSLALMRPEGDPTGLRRTRAPTQRLPWSQPMRTWLVLFWSSWVPVDLRGTVRHYAGEYSRIF